MKKCRNIEGKKVECRKVEEEEKKLKTEKLKYKKKVETLKFANVEKVEHSIIKKLKSKQKSKRLEY